MGIVQLPTALVAQVGNIPTLKTMGTTDNFSTITTAGYLNAVNADGFAVSNNDLIFVEYSLNQATGVGTIGIFTVSITNGVITLVEWINPGDVLLPVVNNDFANFNGTSGQIKDAGYSPSNAAKTKVVMANGTVAANNLAVFTDTAGTIGQNLASLNNVANSSATPGTVRSIVGQISSTATTQTSGNLVGVRGVVNMVGSSTSAYIYGVQGKIIATGTLASGQFQAGVFGQLDLSAATLNAGQIAAVWGDWGTTGATATNMTGANGFAFTNTTANVLNSQFYMYGPATDWFELNDNSGAYGASYITSGGSGGLSGTIKKLAISINGVQYYIPCATIVS